LSTRGPFAVFVVARRALGLCPRLAVIFWGPLSLEPCLASLGVALSSPDGRPRRTGVLPDGRPAGRASSPEGQVSGMAGGLRCFLAFVCGSACHPVDLHKGYHSAAREPRLVLSAGLALWGSLTTL
jgi:hypothetical protein